MDSLKDKNILLFIPNGKGIYGSGISNELEKIGANVKVYDERPSQSNVTKIALRLGKNFLTSYLFNYYKKTIEENKNTKFDFILVIRGEGLTPEIMQFIKKRHPNAYYILYLWDSIKNNNTLSVLNYFDNILSFDSEDVKKYSKLRLRPLFYLPYYKNLTTPPSNLFDVIFIGTIHSNRYGFIKELESDIIAKELKSFFYFYLPSKILYFQKRFNDSDFKETNSADFNYKMLPADQVSQYMGMTKSSLDIECPGQSGLTMRTIEVLGAKRKLITTNERIKEYDFFDANNILVVDRNKPEVDVDFINSPFAEVEREIYESYSLKGWISDVFSAQ